MFVFRFHVDSMFVFMSNQCLCLGFMLTQCSCSGFMLTQCLCSGFMMTQCLCSLLTQCLCSGFMMTQCLCSLLTQCLCSGFMMTQCLCSGFIFTHCLIQVPWWLSMLPITLQKKLQRTRMQSIMIHSTHGLVHTKYSPFIIKFLIPNYVVNMFLFLLISHCKG